ncbi:MAG: type II/IV secretion system protein [Actinomycetia bacterium]|nr:type II/IV secretion system protein [Actinomycetes bacterium]
MLRRNKSDDPARARGTRAIAKGAIRFDSSDHAVLNDQIQRWLHSERPRLGEVLLELGIIEPDALLDALEAQAQADPAQRLRLGQVLVQRGALDDVALAAALSRQFGVPLADLRAETPDPHAVELIPEDLARAHKVLPLSVEGDRVHLASADPYDVDAIRALAERCGKVAMHIGAASDIERQLDQAYNALRATDEMIQAFELTYDESLFATDSAGHLSVDEDAPIVQVVNSVVTQGVRSRASDIHVEPTVGSLRVRYRIDGAMTEAITLPRAMGPGVASRIKVMAELNIVERRRPQDGQFGLQVDGRPIDVRCSVVPTVNGEKIVLRLLDKTRSLISLPDLGMSAEVAAAYRKIAIAPLGMILCTGPTGSGKTTTLYATLNEVNDPTKNVVTIEDPVEYQFDGITQMPVTGTGISFAEGLRGILRQDPDVILVGEIRDEETARIGMQASLTGHLVLSSLHAVDSVAAIHRFTDMGIEPFLVASAISGVVGQRLLRRICTGCATDVQPTEAEMRMVHNHTGSTPARWLRGAGCNLCAGTGYRGRIGVYELLEVNDSIRDLIVARATHHEIRAAAIAAGMRTMQSQAFALVAAGYTTVDDVVRNVYAPGMEMEVPEGGSAPAPGGVGAPVPPAADPFAPTGPTAVPDPPREAG